MPRPTKYDDIKPKIKAEYETGHKKAIDLSKEYGVPRNTISRWINEELWNISEQKKQAIIKSVEVMEHLTEQTEQEQYAHNKIVKEKTKHIELINSVTAFGVKLIGKKMQEEQSKLSMTDLKAGIEAIDKASLTLGVNQRHSNATTTINNNNTNATQVNTKTLEDFYEDIN